MLQKQEKKLNNFLDDMCHKKAVIPIFEFL